MTHYTGNGREVRMHGRGNRSRKARAALFVTLLALCLCAERADGQRDLRVESVGNRLALAIGNNSYRRGVLKNAANDARSDHAFESVVHHAV